MEIRKQPIEEFIKELSSKAPVPGGGGASALAGALGNSLGQMVANLTIGKKRYAQVEEEVLNLLSRMEEIQEHFLRLADEDAKVFAPLAASYTAFRDRGGESLYGLITPQLRRATLCCFL